MTRKRSAASERRQRRVVPTGPGSSSTRGNAVTADAPAAGGKYATATVYDPAAGQVIGADGQVATAPTLAELSLMPGPLAVLDRLYECEDATEEHITLLAAAAGCTVAALETKRHDWRPAPAYCPATVRLNRRRCWKCPRWLETNETSF